MYMYNIYTCSIILYTGLCYLYSLPKCTSHLYDCFVVLRVWMDHYMLAFTIPCKIILTIYLYICMSIDLSLKAA